jgi:hypothetical protein
MHTREKAGRRRLLFQISQCCDESRAAHFAGSAAMKGARRIFALSAAIKGARRISPSVLQ